MTIRLLGALALVCSAWGQTPAFEVASVKMSEPITPELVNSGRLQMGVTIDSKYVRISKLSLLELVALAFQVKGHEFTTLPWMATQRYDIQAKLPEGASRGQVPAMLQELLAERLKLKYHREPQERKVYALVVAKGGHKMKEAAPDETTAPVAAAGAGQIRGGLAVAPGGSVAIVGAGGNSAITPGPNGGVHVESPRMTMGRLVNTIGRYVDLPLLDMTDLKGEYEVALDVSGEDVRNAARSKGFAMRTTPAGEEASDPVGASLRTSLEKLGLKLEGRKLAVNVIVVDSAEKIPAEN
jgi:uncharacterized protein (TIGR03435 family)